MPDSSLRSQGPITGSLKKSTEMLKSFISYPLHHADGVQNPILAGDGLVLVPKGPSHEAYTYKWRAGEGLTLRPIRPTPAHKLGPGKRWGTARGTRVGETLVLILINLSPLQFFNADLHIFNYFH